MKLRVSTLYSHAVDYKERKSCRSTQQPLKSLIKFKTGFAQAGVTGARELDYYVLERVLGYTFSTIGLLDPDEHIETTHRTVHQASEVLWKRRVDTP